MSVERFIAWSETASAEERADAIAEFTAMYHEASISGSDRSACEKIFTITLDDPNPAVRAALSNGLANSSSAPVALVWALASDIAEVSCQLIEQSPKLGSEALCSLLKSTDEAVQSAIARRRILDGTTVRTLVQIGEPRAVLELLKNTKVLLGPILKHDIAERVGHDPDIRAHLLRDDTISPATRQMLVLQLSRSLFDMAQDNDWVGSERIRRAANDSANRVTVDIAMATEPQHMEHYVDHLIATDQLTPALLLRSICAGNAVFFETAIAKLSETSLKRVQSIVDEGRVSAFRSLYKRTGLPQSAYSVFVAAISVWHELGAAHFEVGVSEEWLSERAVMNILDKLGADNSVDPELLGMLHRLAAEATRDRVRNGKDQLLLEAA